METLPSVEVLLTRLDGKIDLIQQAVQSSKEDMLEVRRRLHDLSGEMQKIIALNVPGKLEQHTVDIEKLGARTLLLETDLNMRRGAITLARLLWGLGGAGLVGGVVAVVRIIGG